MLKLAGFLAVAWAIPAICAASPNLIAETVYITYDGTVTSGFDASGVFGTAKSDLAGDPFTVRFAVDRSTPGARTERDFQSSFIDGSGAADPVSAVVTIGGHSFDVGLGVYGQVYSVTGIGPQEITAGAQSAPHTSVAAGILNFSRPPWSNPYFADPLSYTVQPGDRATADFQAGDFGNSAKATAALSSVSVTLGGPVVPEPATWAMMLLGLGGVGAVMRARRRAAVAA